MLIFTEEEIKRLKNVKHLWFQQYWKKVQSLMDDETKKEWLSWISRAISDYNSAKKLFSGKNKFLDTSVFHCQQAVEKILKSFLVYREVKFEKVHNIVYLLDICSEIDNSFQKWYTVAEIITPYANFSLIFHISNKVILDVKKYILFLGSTN